MGPSGNLQGGFKFLNLTSGKKIVRRSWDIIPMPQTVIDRVNLLGKDQPELLIFTDRKGQPIGDVEDIHGADDHAEDDDVELPGVPGGNQTHQDAIPEINETEIDINDLNINEANPMIDTEPGIEIDIVPDANQETEPAPVAPVPDAPAETAPPIIATPDEIPGVRRSTRVRTRASDHDYVPSMSGSSKYAYAVTQLETQGVLHPDAHMFFQTNIYRSEPDVVAAIMTQLSLKAGLREWGKSAHKAVHSEMKQLHFRDTSRPRHWKELTHTEQKSILESHMFLKEKRSGEIKGRAVAGGNKQRDFISKEEASSPTVAT
jgi:hypothetical protein